MQRRDFLNTDEAAKFLGVHKSYLYQLVHRKKVPYYKPTGGLLFFDPVELEAYIRAGRIEAEETQKSEVT